MTAGKAQAQTLSGRENLPVALAAGWSLGSLAMSVMYQATSVLVLRYLVSFIGIPAILAGVLIGASKVFDAVIDPLIGIASDRTQTRIGRRRPYLLVGGVASAASFWLLFHVPILEKMHLRVAAVEIALLLTAAGYSLFNIPYLAMPPEMTSTSEQRTGLTAYRIAAVSVGTIVASVIGPIVIDAGGGGLAGHRLMADLVSVILFAAAMGCFLTTARAPFRNRGVKSGFTFQEQFRLAARNTPFVVLMGVKLIMLVGGAVSGGIMPFLFVEVMTSTYSVMAQYFLISSVVMILSQPIWVALCRRYGKRPVFFVITPIGGVISATWLLAGAHEPHWAIFVRAALGGVFGGGTFLITQSLLPDTIAWDYRQTGLRREGVFAGVYTTIEKVAYALGPAVAGIILGAFGYIPSTGGAVTQPASAISGVYICLIFPIVCAILTVALFTQYRLTEAMLREPDRMADRPAIAV
jgi:GPH family glycoside/pentoside/hexuronide:cation symporter